MRVSELGWATLELCRIARGMELCWIRSCCTRSGQFAELQLWHNKGLCIRAWNRGDDEIILCRMATREHASKIRLVGILKDACRVKKIGDPKLLDLKWPQDDTPTVGTMMTRIYIFCGSSVKSVSPANVQDLLEVLPASKVSLSDYKPGQQNAYSNVVVKSSCYKHSYIVHKR